MAHDFSQDAVIDFSVAIPTYNGAQRIGEVLDQLLAQTGTEGITWEVLVVDNNSSDETAAVVQQYQACWPSQFPLRYCFEPQQGLAYARQRAIAETTGEFVGFLDDDNIPTPNWVSAAYEFGSKNPTVGAFGGKIEGDFEVSPPEDFQIIAPFLAITNRGSKPRIYEPQNKLLPPGAGLVVRRKAWLESVPNQFMLIGRVNNQMLAGEDLEISSYMQQKGWEIWYNPAMLIYHKIPRWRLEREYLIKLFRGIGLSRYATRMISRKKWQFPFYLILYMGNDLRKILHHLLIYRQKFKTQLVADCYWQLLVYSFLSPIYFWFFYQQPSQPSPPTTPENA